MKFVFYPILIISIVGISGCEKHSETVTSGHRFVLVTDPYLSLMQEEVDQFMSLYPEVNMEVQGTSTREAIVHLLNDSVRSIVIDRPFNEEEKQIIKQASIRIVENKIADDGVAIVVHYQNRISSIDTESILSIITGEATNWNQIGEGRSSAPIDFVLTGRNSGMYELLQEKIFSARKPLKPSSVVNSQHEVLQYVSMYPQSVGFVAASLITRKNENIKVLPVSVKSQDGSLTEYLPGQQEIYSSLYPFHYSLYLYNAEAKAAVGAGFSAMVLSNVGQKIIQRAGLVPAAIPYRTIQLHAE